jgi:hypothetical protein
MPLSSENIILYAAESLARLIRDSQSGETKVINFIFDEPVSKAFV